MKLFLSGGAADGNPGYQKFLEAVDRTKPILYICFAVAPRNRVARYADFAAQVDAQIDKLIDIKQEIAAVITEVPDTTLRTLLTKRYLNFEKWEKIAVDLNYSWRQVMRLHGQALRAAEPLIANMA